MVIRTNQCLQLWYQARRKIKQLLQNVRATSYRLDLRSILALKKYLEIIRTLLLYHVITSEI